MRMTQTLVGTFLGLVFVIVVGTMSVTAEYRRGLIRTTVAASPRRGRILAAKAVWSVPWPSSSAWSRRRSWSPPAARFSRQRGVRLPTTTATVVRVVAGTAALLATAAVLAVALGALVRRSAVAVTLAIVRGAAVPARGRRSSRQRRGLAAAHHPAAAFAVQQSTREYAQVDNLYVAASGYFPLAPWAGFAVLCAWTGAGLAASGGPAGCVKEAYCDVGTV